MGAFAPATRHQLRARIALDGPTGAGKTWTALAWAEQLAGPDGRVAVVDTERGSASLYSDRYSFDVLEWVPPYDPRKLADTIREADAEGYDVLVLDSLTHFWKGEGGTMDIVDAAGARASGNNFAGWKVGTPALRSLIDTMLGCRMHVVATMRSKMEHVLVEDERGRKVPTKIGMQPEMRADIEYEFTLCMSMDLEHRAVVSKTRCEQLDGLMVQPGVTQVRDVADVFLTWLREGAPEAVLVDPLVRDYLIAWGNSLDGGLRNTVRELWPAGVPTVRDERLTAAHAERITRVMREVAGDPPPEVAALLAPAAPPAAPDSDATAPPAVPEEDPAPAQHEEDPEPQSATQRVWDFRTLVLPGVGEQVNPDEVPLMVELVNEVALPAVRAALNVRGLTSSGASGVVRERLARAMLPEGMDLPELTPAE